MDEGETGSSARSTNQSGVGWVDAPAGVEGRGGRLQLARGRTAKTQKKRQEPEFCLLCGLLCVVGSVSDRKLCSLFTCQSRRVCLAGSGVPLGAVRLQPEVRARHEGLGQVLRIVDPRPHQQIDRAVGLRSQPIDILGDDGVLAVGHAVLAQVALPHVRGRDLQRAARSDRSAPLRPDSHRHRIPRSTAAARGRPPGDLPFSDGMALPCLLGRRLALVEVQEPRLLTGVELHLQRVVVVPGDVQPSRLARDAADAVRLALIAGGVVLGQIPRVGDAAAFGVERHAGVVAFRRRHHAEAPVFSDQRDPVAGRIEDSRRLWRARRRRWLPTTPLPAAPLCASPSQKLAKAAKLRSRNHDFRVPLGPLP